MNPYDDTLQGHLRNALQLLEPTFLGLVTDEAREAQLEAVRVRIRKALVQVEAHDPDCPHPDCKLPF